MIKLKHNIMKTLFLLVCLVASFRPFGIFVRIFKNCQTSYNSSVKQDKWDTTDSFGQGWMLPVKRNVKRAKFMYGYN